jgi:hypothetical protein
MDFVKMCQPHTNMKNQCKQLSGSVALIFASAELWYLTAAAKLVILRTKTTSGSRRESHVL